MSVVFCVICNNTLDISKTKNSKNIVPTSLSESDDTGDNVNYGNIIDLLLNDKIPSNEDMQQVDFITLQKHPKFKEKTAEQQKIIKKMIDKLLNKYDKDKDNLNIYFVCDSCSYSQKIKSNELILTRSKSMETSREERPIAKWRNMFFSNILPHTREYNCNNKLCPTYNGVQKSVKFIRETNSTETLYLCEVCNEVWKISIQ